MRNRVVALSAFFLFAAIPAFAQRPEDRRPNDQRGEERHGGHGPSAPRANQGRIPEAPQRHDPHATPEQDRREAGASIISRMSIMTIGTVTTARTISAITWTIPSSTVISNTLGLPTGTESNVSIATAIFSGSAVASRFKLLRGTGAWQRTGAGIARTTL